MKVVITGASRGLGKAIKTRLDVENIWANKNQKNWKISQPSYEVTDWSRSTGFDLTDEYQIGEAAMNIEANPPDILILNAGVWKNNWRLNFESQIELIEQMPKEKLSIVILSNAAYQDYGNSAYSAAKSGLLLYARRKQREGFNIITVSPGTIDGTNFWDGAKTDNRKKGAMPVETVAELIYQAIKAWENGCLITEMIVLPRKEK